MGEGKGRNELVRLLWGGKGVWGWRKGWKGETGELRGASVGCKGSLGGVSGGCGGECKEENKADHVSGKEVWGWREEWEGRTGGCGGASMGRKGGSAGGNWESK